MSDNFERRLRESLQARAGEVSPDPAMFAEVQSRIRRGRRLRYALAGGLAAAAIAALAVVAPGLIDRRIEFEPAPVATQPPPEPTEPTVGELHADVLVTDGETVTFLASGGDEVTVAESDAITHLAVAPGSTRELLTHVRRVDEECGVLEWSTDDVTGSDPVNAGGGRAFEASCATAPVFSPDGGHLAWLAIEPDGTWWLHTVDWSPSGPGDDDATFELPAISEMAAPPPGANPMEAAELEAWVWTDQPSEVAQGHLVVRVLRNGVAELVRLPIERQDDGAIALPSSDVAPVVGTSGGAPLAFASGGGGLTYTLEAELAPGGPADTRIVRLTGEGPDGTVDVPPFAEPRDFGSVWMSAGGDTVLVGNAEGRSTWLIDWSTDAPEPQFISHLVHGVAIAPESRELEPSEPPSVLNQVDVYFGMTGADGCVADQPVQREVEGQGVARGALTHLLEGPTNAERDAGIASPFGPETAGALNDVTIVDGEARVDFGDFSDAVDDDSCTKSAILDGLDKTLLQFPSVQSTRYSFDGDVAAFQRWLGAAAEPMGDMPQAVAETAERIRAAASERNDRALRRLMPRTFSCTYSDQPEGPQGCIDYWRGLEDQGEDPLGTLAGLLEGPPGHISDAGMWVWPAAWADPDSDYMGHRAGIAADGTWRYYNQPGG